ncbi:MAG: 2-oxoacid:acceptor oxidoreductase family protein [Planctomycetes bacterium]|nr:2-oxoacid:acceptor oxidoreductase family protein [Planctomycetota bacterium]
MSMLTVQRNDMCYCPGCSHGLLLERLGAAMQRVGLPTDRVCIVSDIGCIGTADRYFECHTFHGLHGRSFTYAEGIKRVRPELTVIVLVGDGGCGIGTAHLVHSARRDAGIKVLVCNNFNFGMTGGQQSPTTPELGRTATTPWGTDQRPFDICRTAQAAGAGFVARGSAHAEDATDLIEAALRSPGFALVDLWELCVAYYVVTNKLAPSGLVELSRRLDMPFGILENRPTAAREPLGGAAAASRDGAELRVTTAVPRLAWEGRTEICVAGSAGQHICSAAGVIGEIAVAGGLFAAQQDDFPITVRKGHSVSNLILSNDAILYAGLDHPDVMLLLSEDGLRRLGSLDALAPTCRLFVDDSLAIPPTAAAVHRLDGEAMARGAGRAGAALAALVHALQVAGRIDGAALVDAARAALCGKYRDANLRAIEFGLTLGQEHAAARQASGNAARSTS